MARILVVDDDIEALLLLKTLLKRSGHQPLLLTRATKLPDEIQRAQPDLLILDLMMPGVMGGMAYDAVRSEIGPALPIIISSGTKIKIRAKDDPLLRYCPKPVDSKLLMSQIHELLQLAAESEMDEPNANMPEQKS